MKTDKGKTKRNLLRILALLLPLCLLFSGCVHGHRQLNEKTILQGLGIDRTEDGQFLISMQTFDTAKASNTSELTDSLTTTYTAKGETIAQAIANSQTILDKEIFDAQNRLIVIGESMADTPLDQLLDYFIRYYDTNANVEVAFAKGKAADIIQADCRKAAIPARKVQDSIRNGEYNAKSTDLRLYNVINAMKNPTEDVYLPLLHPFKEEEGTNVSVSGTAVFHRNKLAGYLDEEQTNGLLWLNQKSASGTLVVETAKHGKISLRVFHIKVKLKGSVRNGRPHFEIQTTLGCDISELQNSPNVPLADEDVPVIQKALEQAVEKRIKRAFDTCVYEYGADVFGLAQALYFGDSAYYRETAGRWHEVLPTSTMHQSVKATVERAGQETVMK